MRTDDTTYIRGWKWRARYSHCGGIGAGLGEANEGVECGRTTDCLAARMVEKDVECDAAELEALCAETAKAEIDGRHWNGSSYSTQEIVGIGGKVKTKVKKRIPVGDIVKEYEDERNDEKFLDREHTGANRSWCSWCKSFSVVKGMMCSRPACGIPTQQKLQRHATRYLNMANVLLFRCPGSGRQERPSRWYTKYRQHCIDELIRHRVSYSTECS